MVFIAINHPLCIEKCAYLEITEFNLSKQHECVTSHSSRCDTWVDIQIHNRLVDYLTKNLPLRPPSEGRMGYAGGFWGAADWAPRLWDDGSWSDSAAGAAPPGWTPRDNPTACETRSTCERVKLRLLMHFFFLFFFKYTFLTESNFRRKHTYLQKCPEVVVKHI